jgi:glucose/mannose-6-phosphate isomerase
MNLDNLREISKMDSENMFEMVYSWPDLIEKTLNQSFDLPSRSHYSQIVICGMGGSAVSGDYVQAYFENSLTIPILIKRNYHLPKSIDANALVIAVSYSGNTEETISCLIDAIQSKYTIISIGSGGKLENYCESVNIPFFRIPSGFQPRASFPLILFPILRIFEELHIANIPQNVIADVLSHLREIRELLKPEAITKENQAKILALKIHNKIPIIWSSLLCVANRFKCQINENAKQMAIAEELPEFNHNHIAAFDGLTTDNPYVVIIFRFSSEHPNVSLRFEISKEIVQKYVEIHEIVIEQEEILTQMIIATYIGDYISMYLAVLNKQDPSRIDSINLLKDQLEKRGNTQSTLMRELDSLKGW